MTFKVGDRVVRQIWNEDFTSCVTAHGTVVEVTNTAPCGQGGTREQYSVDWDLTTPPVKLRTQYHLAEGLDLEPLSLGGLGA